MRYIIASIICFLLFTQCQPNIKVYPTSSYDTLGVQWMTIDRNNITYYFQGAGTKGASVFTDAHEDAYEKLAPVFNAQLPKKIRFFVWTDWTVAQERLGHFPGFANSIECVCHIRGNQTLGHEMTHILSYWAGGIEPTTYSRFINEGIAVAFDLRGDDKIETARQELKKYNISSVKDMWLGIHNAVPDDLLYPVGGALVTYLYEKNMPEKFFELMKHQTFEEAEQIYGKKQLDDFINDINGRLGI